MALEGIAVNSVFSRYLQVVYLVLKWVPYFCIDVRSDIFDEVFF